MDNAELIARAQDNIKFIPEHLQPIFTEALIEANRLRVKVDSLKEETKPYTLGIAIADVQNSKLLNGLFNKGTLYNTSLAIKTKSTVEKFSIGLLSITKKHIMDIERVSIKIDLPNSVATFLHTDYMESVRMISDIYQCFLVATPKQDTFLLDRLNLPRLEERVWISSMEEVK